LRLPLTQALQLFCLEAAALSILRAASGLNDSMVYIYVVCKRVYERMKVEEWGSTERGERT
jgi:hypothetical protein